MEKKGILKNQILLARNKFKHCVGGASSHIRMTLATKCKIQYSCKVLHYIIAAFIKTQEFHEFLLDFLFQVQGSPVPHLFYGSGEHLHPGFDEPGPILSRCISHRIHNIKNRSELQNCHFGHLDHLCSGRKSPNLCQWCGRFGGRK